MPKAARLVTDRELRALKAPRAGMLKVRVGGAPGLVLRVRANGRKEFVLFYSAGGRRRELALGEYGSRAPALTLDAARRRAGSLLAEIRSGVDPIEKRRAEGRSRKAVDEAARSAHDRAEKGTPLPGSFAALAAAFLADPSRKQQRAESRREFERKVELELVPAWGDRPAGEITRADVWALGSAVAAGQGARRRRPGKPAPVAAATLVKLASSIFAFGLDVGWPGLAGNPCYRALRRIAPERMRRDRILSNAEIVALWTASEAESPALRAFPRLLLLTALRRDSLLGARWSEIEEDDGGLWLAVPAERMKSGTAERVPLSTAAREVLASMGEVHEEFLFPGRSEGRPMVEAFYFRKRLAARMAPLLKGSAVDARPWTWHDLRRTARSLLAAAGASDTVAELLLGHVPAAQRGVAGAYNRWQYTAEKMAAAEALGRRVDEIVTGVRGSVLPFVRGAS